MTPDEQFKVVIYGNHLDKVGFLLIFYVLRGLFIFLEWEVTNNFGRLCKKSRISLESMISYVLRVLLISL